MREHVLGPGDDLRTEDYRKNGQQREPHQTSAEDGQKELRDFHLKYACRKSEELERRGRRQHGGDHLGEKLLAVKAVANALELGFVDALQEKQLAAGPAQSVGNQAANGRSQRGHQAVEPGLARAGIYDAGYKRIDWDGEGARIEHGGEQHAPGAQQFEGGHHGGIFEQERVLGRQGDIVNKPLAISTWQLAKKKHVGNWHAPRLSRSLS